MSRNGSQLLEVEKVPCPGLLWKMRSASLKGMQIHHNMWESRLPRPPPARRIGPIGVEAVCLL
jgi:hypothetical protein